MKTLLTGWFVIKSIIDPTDHVYELLDTKTNTRVVIENDVALPYKVGANIKAEIVAECKQTTELDLVSTYAGVFYLNKRAFDCLADSFKELKCTEDNSFIINGIPHC